VPLTRRENGIGHGVTAGVLDRLLGILVMEAEI
jgi:hypothetical protein